MSYLEKLGKEKGMIMGIEPVSGLLKELDHPERSTKIIHVAGTNGKGSVSTFLAGILSEAGYLVGRYISPAIMCYNEKVQRVDNGSVSYISNDEVSEYITMLTGMEAAKGLTQFELETAMALLAFRDWQCDYAIVECGLGGAHDATNAISDKVMCIFTSISMDHTGILGDSPARIAAVKAGILRNGVKAVSSRQSEEVAGVLDEAASKNNTLIRYASECGNLEYDVTGSYFDVDGDRYHINLSGIYQPDNASTAIMAAKVLFEGTDDAAIPQYIIARALEGARWPARFEVISRNPYIVLDGAHNTDGIIRLKESIEVLFERDDYYIIGIMGVFKDKDVSGMTTVIYDSFDELHTVTAPSSRGMDSFELADIIKDTGFTGTVMAHNDITARKLAYRLAMNEPTKAAGDDRGVVIVIFGSLSLAAG